MSINNMVAPVINLKTNEWYARGNNVKVPRIAEAKDALDSFWTEQGGGGIGDPDVPDEHAVVVGSDYVTVDGVFVINTSEL